MGSKVIMPTTMRDGRVVISYYRELDEVRISWAHEILYMKMKRDEMWEDFVLRVTKFCLQVKLPAVI